MKKFIIIAFLFLTGCFNQLSQMSGKVSKIDIGMSESQVISAIGKPSSVAAKEGVKMYNYKLYSTASQAIMDGTPDDFYILFKNGVVAAYGSLAEIQALSK